MSQDSLLIISLGSNIQPVENLRRSVDLLRQRARLVAVASVWETTAVGTAAPNFFNSAASVRISGTPQAFKAQVLRPIEEELGRVRSSDKFAPRPIDLDPILFNREILDDQLWSTAYLAVPVAELAPDLVDPATGDSLAATAARLARESRPIHHPEVSLNIPPASK